MLKKLVIFLGTLFLVEALGAALAVWVLPNSVREFEEVKLPQRLGQLQWFKESGGQYHPFLAYYSESNEASIQSALELKKEGQKRPIVIAILGGSFANGFAHYLESDAGRKFIESFEIANGLRRSITTLNLAYGGYRQPQQTIASILYYDLADIFISIEGFNEVRRAVNQCLPRHWPRQSIRFSHDRIPKLLQLRAKVFKGVVFAGEILVNSGSYAGKLLAYWTHELAWKRLINVESQLFSGNGVPCFEKEQLGQLGLEGTYWIEDLKKHQIIFQGLKKPLLTYLQPNQYDPGSKTWSKEEKRIFVGFEHLKRRIENVYPEIKASFLKLKQEQSSFRLIDMSNVFQHEKAAVYIDSCCHVGPKGNQILAEFILPNLLGEILKLNRVARE